MVRALLVPLAATITGGIVFNAATIAMPKLIEERIAALADAPMLIGLAAACIYACGAASQWPEELTGGLAAAE
jgi:hypothetical protein